VCVCNMCVCVCVCVCVMCGTSHTHLHTLGVVAKVANEMQLKMNKSVHLSGIVFGRLN